MSTENTEISPLAAEIAAQERPCWEFEASLFLDKSRARKVKGKFRMRVARVAELQDAMDNCERYIKRRAKDTGLESDSDYTTNLRTAYILHAVTLQMDADAPAFPHPQWMMEQFSTEELTVLLNHYKECVRLSGPLDSDLDAEKAEGIAAILAKCQPDQALTELAKFSQTQLGALVLLLSVKVDVLKQELAASSVQH